MPEISSPKNILIPDVKVDKTGSNPAGLNRVLVEKEAVPEKDTLVKFSNPDTFKSDSTQKNIPKSSELTKSSVVPQQEFLSEASAKMADMYAQMRDKVNINKQKFIDVSDKLAAIYGEKEKDTKDKLSDTFKRMILKPFDALSGVDASMEQSTHNSKKKLRDREPEGQSQNIFADNKKRKERHWINYKLFEIFGEILAIGALLRKRHRSLRKKFHRNYKNFKKGMIAVLDKIDSLFESTNSK